MIFDPKKNSMIKALDYFSKLVVKGKTIEIKEYKPKRSNLQNRYYWAIITMLSQETGNEKNDLHHYFKFQFLPFLNAKIEIGKWKDCDPYSQSTTILNTKQFTDYIEKIRIFASTELCLSIPYPEDKHYLTFVEMYN